MNVQTTKMMYVFHWICLIAIGQANWLSRPAALTKKDWKAMPFARISNEMHSTG